MANIAYRRFPLLDRYSCQHGQGVAILLPVSGISDHKDLRVAGHLQSGLNLHTALASLLQPQAVRQAFWTDARGTDEHIGLDLFSILQIHFREICG